MPDASPLRASEALVLRHAVPVSVVPEERFPSPGFKADPEVSVWTPVLAWRILQRGCRKPNREQGHVQFRHNQRSDPVG